MNDSILDQTELIPYRGGLWYVDPNCRAVKILKFLEEVLRDGRCFDRWDIGKVVAKLSPDFIIRPDYISAGYSPELLLFNNSWHVVNSKFPEMRAVRYLETVLERPLTRLDIDSVARFLPIKIICKLDPAKND